MKIFTFIRRQMVPLVVLCSFGFLGSEPAQAQVSTKTDPGTNNPPPAGAILDLSGTPIPGGGNPTYQHYAVDFNATLTSTAITLAFRDDPAQVSVANVSVVDLTSPNGNLLVNGDFSQGPVGSNTPTGWTYANIFGVFAGGGVASGSRFCYTSAFCWFDGAVLGYDAISQTIATAIGDTYQISFDVAEDSAIFATPGSHGGLFPATYPGSDCYLAANNLGPSPCKFSDISINGDTTDPGGNGINVTAYAQGGLPLPGTQVQTTPAPPNPNGGDTTVSTVFNNTPGQHVENDVILPPSNNLTFPSGIDPTTLSFQSTNRLVSNANPYTSGTPFATFVPFDHAGNDAPGNTGNGSKYEVVCSDATHPPAEANCPSPGSAGTHIRAFDIFDLPKDTGGNFIQPIICQPGVACGTTVSFLHWFPNTIPGNASWSASNMPTNPACTNVTMTGFACDLEDILVNKYGASNGYGSDTKKGDYFLGYNVPMLLSAVKVSGANGTTSVNTPGIQGSSPFFFRSPLTFDFLVTPAQCPACGNGWKAAPVNNLFYTLDSFSAPPPDLPGTTDLTDLTNCPGATEVTACAVTSVTQPGASSTLPVEFTTTPMPISNDGQYLLQWSAADTVKTRERYITIIPTGSPTPCPNPFGDNPVQPCYSTKLFSAQINVDNTPPNITGPTLSPAPMTNNGVPNSYLLNQSVTATYSCADPVVNGVASGVKTCGPGNTNSTSSQVPTSATGSFNFTVNTTDVVGNVGTPVSVPYTVVDQPADLDLFYFAPPRIKPGANLAYFIAALNLAQKNVASGVTVTDIAPAGTAVVSAVFDKVSCSWWGCSIPKTGTPCIISGSMITCNIGSLAPLNTLTGVGILIVVNVPATTPLGTVLTDTATATSLNTGTDKDTSVIINTTVRKY